MKVHVVNVMRAAPGETGRTLDRFARFSRGIEERGFAGLWVTDSFGRGRPTLDPIVLMSVIAAVTQKIEIGTCVLQVPVRHPAELAHRIQSLHALTGSRLQLGLGCGSTQADFDLVGADYTARFKRYCSGPGATSVGSSIRPSNARAGSHRGFTQNRKSWKPASSSTAMRAGNGRCCRT